MNRMYAAGIFVFLAFAGCVEDSQVDGDEGAMPEFVVVSEPVPSGSWVSFISNGAASFESSAPYDDSGIHEEWTASCSTVVFDAQKYPFTFASTGNYVWAGASALDLFASVQAIGGFGFGFAAIGSSFNETNNDWDEQLIGHAAAGSAQVQTELQGEALKIRERGDYYCFTGPEQFAEKDYEASYMFLEARSLTQTLELEQGMLLHFEHNMDASLLVTGPTQAFGMGKEDHSWICVPEPGTWTLELSASGGDDWEFAIQIFDKAQPDCPTGVLPGTSYQ